jgi:CHAD domain-containing protein
VGQRFAIEGVTADTPLAVAAPAILLAKASPLFALEEAARSGTDADAVHDMRVASRRLREALRLFRPLYPAREMDAWYRTIRNVTRALGPVRDSDVFIEDFSRLALALGEGGSRAVAFMVGHRMGARAAEIEALRRELGRLDLERTRKSFKRLAKHVVPGPEAQRRLGEYAHAAVTERADAVAAAQPAALSEPDAAAQHQLRIHYKRLRYAVETFMPCYGAEFEGLHATLVAFQDTLGTLHDIHMFREMLDSRELLGQARQGGVSRNDLGEVDALLGVRAHEAFDRFTALVARNPAGHLLPALVLPLMPPEEPRA